MSFKIAIFVHDAFLANRYRYDPKMEDGRTNLKSSGIFFRLLMEFLLDNNRYNLLNY